MTTGLIIAISTVVSLIADVAIDYYLFNKQKVGSEDYKNLLKFAKKNKDIASQANVFSRISDLEDKINSEQFHYTDYTSDINDMKFEIKSLKSQISRLANINTASSNSNTEFEEITKALKALAQKINEIENRETQLEEKVSNQNSGQTVVQKVETDEETKRIVNALVSKIKTLDTIGEANKDLINKLSQEIASLNNTVLSQQEEISNLNRIVLQQKTIITNSNKQTPTATTNKPPVVAENIIIPDKNYLNMLISNLANIKDSLGSLEYRHCENGLKEIMSDGDFDDAEEIMISVHELIEKYIYGSDTKVSASQWKNLEKYLVNAGYVELPVKAGADVTPFRTYFSRPIPTTGGTPNTIKQIQLMPYILVYMDGKEKQSLKLCGKCTYYK